MDCSGGLMERLVEWMDCSGGLTERLVEWTVVECQIGMVYLAAFGTVLN